MASSSARAHSLFPASATARLLACPGSYSLSLAADAGMRRASVFAAEGTLAHLIAQTMLTSPVPDSFFVGRKFNIESFIFEVGAEMVEHCRTYADYIESLRSVGFETKLEFTVNPDHLWKDLPDLPIDLFGTADCVAWHPEWKRLVVVDLKYGAGVLVEPENNPQLLYYAAGALDLVRDTPLHINIVVVQPRKPVNGNVIRQWVTTPEYVQTWARDVLYLGVQVALADMGQTLNPSDYCQFCPAFRTCSAPQQLALDVAAEAFADAGPEDRPADPSIPDPLHGIGMGEASDSKLAELMDASLVLEPLIEEVRAQVKARILSGSNAFPDWEVIHRKGKRTWSEGDDVLIAHMALHLSPLVMQSACSVRTPAQLDKHPAAEVLAPFVKHGAPIPVLQRRAGQHEVAAPVLLSPSSDKTVTQRN